MASNMTPTELRTTRKQLGLSQAGLASLLDVDVMTISRWERGVQPIGNPTILRLALERLADTTKAAPACCQGH